MPIFRPRIAIVGGGPSGLTLGLLLHQYGISATIYEARAKPTPEELAQPSGMLDLHEESGLAAIHECGLFDDFQAAVATSNCSEAMRVLNADGQVLHSDEGELSTRPEIARNALTALLLQHLPTDSIKWSHKIVSASSSRNTSTGATEITLTFDLSTDNTNSSTAIHDLVIGADGAWSRIRPLLSPVCPSYAGAQYLTATIRHISTKHPQLLPLVGSGSMCALGGRNGIMTQRGPQDSLRLYAAISTPDETWSDSCKLAGKTAAQVCSTLLADTKLFASWAPILRDLLSTACNEETADHPGMPADVRPYYMLPVGHRWDHRTGATLVGDAAHLMTPWAGEGVNLAMWDALELAQVLAAATPTRESEAVADAAGWQAGLEAGMVAFEQSMLARAQEKAQETEQNRQMFLGDDGASAMAGFFKTVYEDVAAAGGSPPREE